MITTRSAKKEKRLEIDLAGPQGNAFALLGLVSHLGKQLNMPKAEMDKIRADMMKSDYENLLKIFDEKFGDYVIMYK